MPCSSAALIHTSSATDPAGLAINSTPLCKIKNLPVKSPCIQKNKSQLSGMQMYSSTRWKGLSFAVLENNSFEIMQDCHSHGKISEFFCY